MNVLVLIPSLYNTSPGSRFRIEQWAAHLEREGYRFTFACFEDEALHRVIYRRGHYLRKVIHLSRAMIRRVTLLPLIRKFDVVFLYEETSRLGPEIVERLIHLCRVPIVYDFCDPIYLYYASYFNGRLNRLKCIGKYARICGISTEVIVGNEALGEFARLHSPNVTVVPITIDTDHYTTKSYPSRQEGPVVIGWSGSGSTIPHLESLHDGLRKLLRTTSVPFHLKAIGNIPPKLDGVPMSFIQWTHEAEVRELQQLDIGIMPLPNDTWIRLRTQLKVRQYMGVGVPAVASPFGVIPELIQDGVNGLLADSEDQWVKKLRLLVENPGLREQLGLAGRQTAEEQFSARVWVPRVKAILERAAGTRYVRSRSAVPQTEGSF